MKVNVNEEKIKVSCDNNDSAETLTVSMEECAELIQCVSKKLRGQEDPSHMEEEVADVLIGIHDLIYICDLNEDRIQRWVDLKQNRQLTRIGVKLDE